MKNSDFRAFVQNKYMEHKDECSWYKIKCKYSGLTSYFRKNKYFLKKLYKGVV